LALSPNPFNPMTTIAFNLPESQRVRVEVYDLTGRRIAVVADGMFNAGENRLTWRGTDNGGRSMASGVYFVRVTGPGVELKQRAMLLK
jgi:flagellar hook assembly protein FlgD